MYRYACCLLAAFLLAVTLSGCQSEPLPESAPPAMTSADTEAKVLSLLTVKSDGTVAITDESRMAALLGSAWPGAKGELTALNQRVRAGETNGFRSTADLARYARRQPSYQPRLDETGEANFTPAFSDPHNPQCISKCNQPGTCCCGGFWFLCWSVCACNP